ncbi:S41 family peptidase [Acidisoma sp. 7E03]
MTRRAFLCLLFLSLPFRAEAQSNWNQALAGSVYGAAFAFMQPRTLAPIPMADLTLWGLRGLTALDPSVAPAMTAHQITLYSRGQPALSLPLPKGEDATAWGALAALLCNRATALSPAVAAAGTGGIVTSFFDELFNHLDPYSRYVAPDSQTTDIPPADPGLSLRNQGRHVVVESVTPGGPADRAGIRPGDRVLAIDGVATRGEDLYTLNGALTGAEGSQVSLRVEPRRGRVRNLSMIRTAATPATVFSQQQGSNLLIQITGFDPGTAAAFQAQLAAGLAASPPPSGLILDLRGNRGGLLEQAVTVADSLIPRGTIAQAVGRDPEADQLWRATGQNLSGALPVAVLVDGRTASAAEVLSAAIADDGRGVVIGSATFGKGLVQAATQLPDGGHLLVTWARLLAPLGWPLQGLGVLPQVCTSGDATAVESQLQALSAGQQPLAPALQAERAARPGITLPQILQLRDACPAALGSSLDLQAAQFLLSTPPAYQAALIRP